MYGSVTHDIYVPLQTVRQDDLPPNSQLIFSLLRFKCGETNGVLYAGGQLSIIDF